jgi:hypothetical protein
MEQEINPLSLFDFVLDGVDDTDSIVKKMKLVRERITKYHNNNYSEKWQRETSEDYCHFMFDAGMLSGTISYYKRTNNLTNDHIEDLNKIYKRYK